MSDLEGNDITVALTTAPSYVTLTGATLKIAPD
jgi:hypothetical protein